MFTFRQLSLFEATSKARQLDLLRDGQFKRWVSAVNPGGSWTLDFRNTLDHPPVTDFILLLYYMGHDAQTVENKNQISRIWFFRFARDTVHMNTVKKGVRTRDHSFIVDAL